MALLGEQRVGLGGVDAAAEQVRDVSVGCHGVVVLQRPEALEQQRRRARGLDEVEDGARRRRLIAGQPLHLAVEHEARARLEDVGPHPEDAGVLAASRAAGPSR